MKYSQLIKNAEEIYASNPDQVQNVWALSIFEQGAIWMQKKLQGAASPLIKSSHKFTFYGFFKYALASLAFICSFAFLLRINPALIPFSILVFYLVEVHFLFLFPILIEGKQNPLLNSILFTYRAGLFTCLINVMPIAFYMLRGILNARDPFRNWHIGCLAILIWYKHETGNRI